MTGVTNSNEWSRNIYEWPHCRGGRCFHGGQCNLSLTNCSRLFMPLLRIELFFCCIHHRRDSQCFSVAGQPPEIAPFREQSRPNLIRGSLGPHKSAPRWHLDWFSRFYRAREQNQQTDHATPSSAVGRI